MSSLLDFLSSAFLSTCPQFLCFLQFSCFLVLAFLVFLSWVSLFSSTPFPCFPVLWFHVFLSSISLFCFRQFPFCLFSADLFSCPWLPVFSLQFIVFLSPVFLFAFLNLHPFFSSVSLYLCTPFPCFSAFSFHNFLCDSLFPSPNFPSQAGGEIPPLQSISSIEKSPSQKEHQKLELWSGGSLLKPINDMLGYTVV